MEPGEYKAEPRQPVEIEEDRGWAVVYVTASGSKRTLATMYSEGMARRIAAALKLAGPWSTEAIEAGAVRTTFVDLEAAR